MLCSRLHPAGEPEDVCIILRSEMCATNDRVCGDRRGSEVCSLHLNKTHPRTKSLVFPRRKMMDTMSWQAGFCATSTNTIIYHYGFSKTRSKTFSVAHYCSNYYTHNESAGWTRAHIYLGIRHMTRCYRGKGVFQSLAHFHQNLYNQLDFISNFYICVFKKPLQTISSINSVINLTCKLLFKNRSHPDQEISAG